ncbi:guanine nucleotide-binding protein subunit alpha [Gaertneriomyces sp. JEL0708]|nr:guanine nucleotide-binding protein subunit alpha [Gaertneriomyces sp. JEL0708]
MDDSPAARRQAKKISDEIDQQLKKDKAEQAAIKGPKLLLLGSSDSGKTTVLKQMQILHGNGFSTQERHAYRRRIFNNILESMQALIGGLQQLGVALPEEGAQQHIATITHCTLNGQEDQLPPQLAAATKALWSNETVKKVYTTRSNEFFIQDTAYYFLDDIGRFSVPKYLPSDEDILHCRFRTTDITENRFQIEKLIYRIFDVGGARSDRLYWAPYFEAEVHGILFITSLASYDQMLVEDETVNRMLDALVLFESITNHPLLSSVALILFLNKSDLFAKKLQHSPVAKYFPDFEGPNDLKTASRYFKHKFHAQNKNAEKKIYTHFTTGTDTGHMKVIMSAVGDIVTRLALEASGYV